jgi:hypothetical protein
MNITHIKTIAADLDQYMIFREAKEHQKYQLSAAFFESGLKMGVFAFYGIVVDETGLLCDHRQPTLFSEWIASRIEQ